MPSSIAPLVGCCPVGPLGIATVDDSSVGGFGTFDVTLLPQQHPQVERRSGAWSTWPVLMARWKACAGYLGHPVRHLTGHSVKSP